MKHLEIDVIYWPKVKLSTYLIWYIVTNSPVDYSACVQGGLNGFSALAGVCSSMPVDSSKLY